MPSYWGTSNKKKHRNTRSNSENRKNSSVRNTPPNDRSRTPPNLHSPNNQSSPQNTTQHNMFKISSAPKTICKNKSLPVDKYPFIVNENAGFYADLKDFINVDNVESSFIEDSAKNNIFELKKSPHTSPKILQGAKHVDLNDINSSQNKVPSCATSLKNVSTEVENERSIKSDYGEKSSRIVDKKCMSHKVSNSPKHVQELAENIRENDNNTNQPTILNDEKISPSIERDKHKTVFLKNRLHNRLHKNAKSNQEKVEVANGDIEKHESLQQPRGNYQETCKCEQCDSFVECPAWCNNNLLFADFPNLKRGPPLLKNNIMEKPPPLTTTRDNKLILQGPMVPKAMFSLEDNFMDETIQNTLRALNCTSAKDIQSYMWSAIRRGLSTFIVGPPKCGKTFAYLPPFCTFCMEKNERYVEFSQYDGPLIIILCSTADDCYELQNCTKKFITSGDVTVEVLTDETSAQGKCDILIAVPSVLEHYLKTGAVRIKRLCHIAIEKGHLVLKNQSQSIQKIFKCINIMQTNRPHTKTIQVVVISEKWSLDLETLLKNLNTPSLVCFEDFLEAAVYSKVQFRKKKTKSTYKFFQLSDMLKGHYMTKKTVVFCNEDEIFKLKEKLEVSGIESIAISNNLIEDEVFENEDIWNSLRSGQFKILLCTDSIFEKTGNVLSAQWLVHYHLPSEWAVYQKRFRCLSANISSPLDLEETTIYELESKCSFIMIDELYDDQIFLDFFEILTRNCIKYLQL